jgi:hypothetical protein
MQSRNRRLTHGDTISLTPADIWKKRLSRMSKSFVLKAARFATFAILVRPLDSRLTPYAGLSILGPG